MRKLLDLPLGIKVLIGMALSVPAGYALGLWGDAGLQLADTMAIAGDVFLGLIKMIVVPLVFVAVTLGIAGNDSIEAVRNMGGAIIVYFLMTTTVAVTIGALLAISIEPGQYVERGYVDAVEVGDMPVKVEAPDLSVREIVQGFIPSNLFVDLTTGNMLNIVIFAVAFGAAFLAVKDIAGTKGDHIRTLIGVFDAVQEAIMVIVHWAMKLAPIGVFTLLTDIMARVGIGAFVGVLAYVLAVVGGLLGVGLFYVLVVKFLAGRSPLEFFRAVRDLQVLAFSTSSSAAVMPISLETAEQKLGVRPSVARFVIPLGTTINMDGTALYQAVAAIFLVQVYLGPEAVTLLTVGSILSTAILASIGTPGTPGVGIIVLAGILVANGVPAEGIALILGVDRILDMLRTAMNVTGDQTAALVMDRFLGRDKES